MNTRSNLLIVCAFGLGLAAVLVPVALLNFIVNPYLYFAHTIDGSTRSSADYRFVFPVVAKKLNLRSVIIGSSDAFPYRQPEIRERFGSQHFNFAMEGATHFEQHLLAKLVLANNAEPIIFWQVNWLSFLWKKGHTRLGENFPLDTYDLSDQSLNLKNLFDLNGFTASLKLVLALDDWVHISQLQSWSNSEDNRDFDTDFFQNAQSFNNFVRRNQKFFEQDPKVIKGLIDLYIEDVVTKNQNATFVFVLPPFHQRFLDHISQTTPEILTIEKLVNERLYELATTNKNVKLIDARSSCGFQFNSEMYKDFTHFKNEYAEFFSKNFEIAKNTEKNTTALEC